MQAHNQGEAAVTCLGGELSPPCSKMEMKTVTHPQLLRKGFAWAEVQLYSIATVGEALALPFFKVRFTKRKCWARLIQKKLLMVGRQKVLHTILPGAHVL